MKFTLSRLLLASCAAAPLSIAFSAVATAADWADLKVTFVYADDKIPERNPINMGKDAWCQDAHEQPVLEQTLIVDPASKGIANICILPDRKSGIDEKDINPDLLAKAQQPATLDNVECVFVPHIFSVMAGGSVVVKNSDQTGHNANFNFFANPAANKIIPQGGQEEFKVEKAERAPIPVDCNIHPWMKAFVIVADSPYVGVSNEKGELVIEKMPAGKKISMKVWHENSDGSIEDVVMDGKPTTWKKGVMEITLKPGMNDLGVVQLKADHFKK